ncbi:MAG: transposase [Betaproteobacteria bacterium]
MPRKSRLHLRGGLYHVILRGNAGHDIFFEEEDRFFFYRLLDEGTRRFGYRVHAFCLMDNHIHLALQMGGQPLSKGLQNLTFRYARHINQTQNRAGHLFQGRYKALLVDAENYGLELVRYIHLNPVRERLVTDPADYQYSGHIGYLGKRAFSFLTTDWVLSQFDERVTLARRRYLQFIAEAMGQRQPAEFHQSKEKRVLGDDRFVAHALQASGEPAGVRKPNLDRIVAYVCKGSGLKEEQLARAGKGRAEAQTRALIGWLVVNSSNVTLTEVARRFRRDLSGISRAVSDLERIASEDGAKRKALVVHQNAISEA